jgi:hypothetical protein
MTKTNRSAPLWASPASCKWSAGLCSPGPRVGQRTRNVKPNANIRKLQRIWWRFQFRHHADWCCRQARSSLYMFTYATCLQLRHLKFLTPYLNLWPFWEQWKKRIIQVHVLIAYAYSWYHACGSHKRRQKKTAQANASPCLCQDLFVMDGSRIFSLTALIRYSLLSVCVMSVCVYVYIISILTYGSVYIYVCVCSNGV